jgi:hypothetical protein
VILWDEMNGSDQASHFYAIALDGLNVDELRETSYRLALRYANFDPQEGEPIVPEGLRADAANQLYIVQFVTAPLSEFVQAVEAAGGEVHQFLHHHAYVTRMPVQATPAVRDLPFVRSVVPYHPAYWLGQSLVAELAEGLSSSEERVFSIMVVEPGPPGQQVVADKIESFGRTVYGKCPECIRLEAMLTLDELGELVGMNEILFIE